MAVPDNVLHYFRTVPLPDAEEAVHLFEVILAGRRAHGEPTSEYSDTLREAIETILAELRRPMRFQDILDELNKRYPGRARPSGLRSCLYKNTKATHSLLTRLGWGTFGLRTWPDHVKQMARPRPAPPKPEPGGRLLGSGSSSSRHDRT